jgi:phosphoglycerate kinase
MDISNLNNGNFFIDFSGKIVLLRADFNVPIKKTSDGYLINDYSRINAVLPTIKELINRKPTLIILVSHLGRPKGKYIKDLSLYPIKNYISLQLNRHIQFLTEYYPLVDLSTYKGIVMLENIRFHPEEENISSESLGKYLTKITDIYINEAFSCSHRNHSSIVSVNSQHRLAGRLLMNEIGNLSSVLKSKKKKTLIIGGSKISDKINMIKNLLPSLENLIIGGAMAFSFIKNINNIDIGKTLYDESSKKYVDEIQDLISKYNTSPNNTINLILPIDWVVAENIKSSEENVYTTSHDIPRNYMGLDIGPESIYLFNRTINSLSNDNIIIWNGPMGVFEEKAFSYGTECIVKTLMNKKNVQTIIGGGDSVSALNIFATKEEIDNFIINNNHVSTGGGASLEFLEGKSLPGIKVLNNIL